MDAQIGVELIDSISVDVPVGMWLIEGRDTSPLLGLQIARPDTSLTYDIVVCAHGWKPQDDFDRHKTHQVTAHLQVVDGHLRLVRVTLPHNDRPGDSMSYFVNAP